MEDTDNNTQTAINAGIMLAKIQSPSPIKYGESIPFVMLPEGFKTCDLEKLMPSPARIRAKPTFHTLESFLQYVKSFKEDSLLIFGALTDAGATFEAVFDYHEHETPRWCEHRAIYTCPTSVEWRRWHAKNNTPMNQKEFAEFIEENLPDIITPDGATMLEICLNLTAKTKVEFASGIRLANGNNQIFFEEKTEATAGKKGELSIPEEFEIMIPVFEGLNGAFLKAKIRYRIQDRNLILSYSLMRPHILIRDGITKMIEAIEEKGGVKVLKGSV